MIHSEYSYTCGNCTDGQTERSEYLCVRMCITKSMERLKWHKNFGADYQMDRWASIEWNDKLTDHFVPDLIP
jgi:hypothetical protein